MNLEGIVVKAMAKEPAERYQHADEIPVDLKAIKVRPGGIPRVSSPTVVAAGEPRRSRWRRALPWSLILMAVVVLLMAVWIFLRPTSLTQGPVTRFLVVPPSNERLVSRWGPRVALSPDGTRFVYVGFGEFYSQLYVRAMDQLEARSIPGTEDASAPFFSPDGQWIGFRAEGKLKKVALAGGPPRSIADAPSRVRGASWGPNDQIVFAATDNSGLSQVSAAGGVPQVISTPDIENGEAGHLWPEILPGGKAVVFTSWSGSLEGARIGVLSLETGEVKRLPVGGTYPRYANTGHLVYGGVDGSLVAVRFDLARLEVIGSPVPILEGIMVKREGSAEFTLSHNGSLVYLRGPADHGMLVMVDRRGMARPLMEKPGHFHEPRFSPDGQHIALTTLEGGSHNIWIYDLEQGTLSRLTFEEGASPAWTPDGSRVAFSNRAGTGGLFWISADGSSPAEPLLTAEHYQLDQGPWSPDGQLLVFTERNSTTGRDIWVLPLKGERTPRPFLQTQYMEVSPMLSPDGRWLAYGSNESGRYEVYVRAFPDSGGGKWQISTEGGTEPLWAPNGRELFYRSGDTMVAVVIEAEPMFRVGTRSVLFEVAYAHRVSATNYDIHPDGERFVMVKSEEVSPELIVVLNWFDELKRRVPGGK
jgi:serine/threonine-protein kinase